MPRPPIQHHKLIISFDAEAKEVIEEVRQTFLLGKVSRAIGEAIKGVLGHPVGFVAVAGPLIAFLIAYFVKPEPGGGGAGRDLERELVLIMMSALPVSEEARQQATDNLLGAIRTIRKLFGLEFPPPPPPGEGPSDILEAAGVPPGVGRERID